MGRRGFRSLQDSSSLDRSDGADARRLRARGADGGGGSGGLQATAARRRVRARARRAGALGFRRSPPARLGGGFPRRPRRALAPGHTSSRLRRGGSGAARPRSRAGRPLRARRARGHLLSSERPGTGRANRWIWAGVLVLVVGAVLWLPVVWERRLYRQAEKLTGVGSRVL